MSSARPRAGSPPAAASAVRSRDSRERSFRLSGDVGGRHRVYLIPPGTSSLGSSAGNDLVLPVAGVSRCHLTLRAAGGELTVEDRGSKNGTFVEGRRIGRSPVSPGERITVGTVELVVEEVPAGDATIAIPGTRPAAAPPADAAGEPVASTVHLPSFAPPVLRRWLAAVDRALDLVDRDPESRDPSDALGAVIHELGARAGCLLAVERGGARVVAAAGAVRGQRLLDRLDAALRDASGGDPGAAFSLDGPPSPAAFWVESRPPGGRGIAVEGEFPGREQSEPLLRMLTRVLDRPARSAGAARAPRTGVAGTAGGLRFPAGYVVGRSPAMRELYRRLARVAASTDPVLLIGETGTGKEPLAATVHRSSPRRDGPLVSVNCAAIPAELLEAELFGVARGAATGVAERRGHFLAARGGTLVLDEIGELPLGLQAKLLRAIENREIPRLGGGVEVSDARIVATTNRDLGAETEVRAFRADLYYRIATHELRVPPLRDRPEDVPALIENILARTAAERGRRLAGVTSAALELLIAHPWPGNVRELENEVRRLVAACPDGGLIDSRMVSPALRETARRGGPAAPEPARSLPERIAEVERAAIERALVEAAGNRTRAAELLGIHRNSLAAKISRLGIDPRELPERSPGR